MRGDGSAQPTISRTRRPFARQNALESLAEIGVAQSVEEGVDSRVQIAEPVS